MIYNNNINRASYIPSSENQRIKVYYADKKKKNYFWSHNIELTPDANNYDDLNDYLNGAAARTIPSDDDDSSGKAYKWNDQRKVTQMGETHLFMHEQQQQSLSKKRPSIIPTTTDNLSLEAYSAMLYKHRQATSQLSSDDSDDDDAQLRQLC